MRKLGLSFVLGLVPVVSAVQTPTQSAVPVTLIKADRLPVSSDPLADITELERVRLGMKGRQGCQKRSFTR